MVCPVCRWKYYCSSIAIAWRARNALWRDNAIGVIDFGVITCKDIQYYFLLMAWIASCPCSDVAVHHSMRQGAGLEDIVKSHPTCYTTRFQGGIHR